MLISAPGQLLGPAGSLHFFVIIIIIIIKSHNIILTITM
jgi:hypothetical protein